MSSNVFFNQGLIAGKDLQPENPWQFVEPMADDIGCLAIGCDEFSFPMQMAFVGVLVEINTKGFVLATAWENADMDCMQFRYAYVRRRAPVPSPDPACGNGGCAACESPAVPVAAPVSPDKARVDLVVHRYEEQVDKIDKALSMFRLGVVLNRLAMPDAEQIQVVQERVQRIQHLLQRVR